jgi:prephenate dehydrogenase
MRIALLGFGLIGGSIARAVREREPGWRVAAWTPGGSGPRQAVADGVVDVAAGSVEEAIAGSELVVLAAPPLGCLELLDRLAGLTLADDAVVTDVASTKRRIVDRARELGLPFVGGHPMAGRETTGYGSSEPDLFAGRPWVVCVEGADPGHVERVERLASATRARPIRMAAAAHDDAVAAVSHLPLVVSAALVEAVTSGSSDWAAARGLAAGGWASMTRLARGDVEMGAGILATNADAVAGGLRTFRDVLDAWLGDLEAGEPDALRARLARAREILDSEP